ATYLRRDGGDGGAPMAKKDDAVSKRLAEVSDDLSPAVRRLLSELDWLLSELEKASSAVPASPESERQRYIYILVALSKFVRKVGGTLEQVCHIVELAQLLADLDLGIVGPALERTRFGKGRTGDSSLVWQAPGRVAVGLGARVARGERRQCGRKPAFT